MEDAELNRFIRELAAIEYFSDYEHEVGTISEAARDGEIERWLALGYVRMIKTTRRKATKKTTKKRLAR